MRMMKVYNAEGKHVDSFALPTKSMLWNGHPKLSTMIRTLNSHGLYVRRQFSRSGKTLIRSMK